jgi:hypothetical protein
MALKRINKVSLSEEAESCSELLRNLLTSPMIPQLTALLGLLATTCSTGRLPSWDP